jgi:CBS domain containing-hemolysin-like protein
MEVKVPNLGALEIEAAKCGILYILAFFCLDSIASLMLFLQEKNQCKENDEVEQAKQLKASIEEKLNQASVNREENMHKMIARIQEHEETVAKANVTHKEQLEALREKINQQLTLASERREAKLQTIVENANKKHDKVHSALQNKRKSEDALRTD